MGQTECRDGTCECTDGNSGCEIYSNNKMADMLHAQEEEESGKCHIIVHNVL